MFCLFLWFYRVSLLDIMLINLLKRRTIVIDTLFIFILFVILSLSFSTGIRKLSDVYEDKKKEKQNGQ